MGRLRYPRFVVDHPVRCAPDDDAKFFPASKTATYAHSAKRLCRPCPARDACLRWAMTTSESQGVLGGFTPRERARIATQVPHWKMLTAVQLELAIKTTTPSAS